MIQSTKIAEMKHGDKIKLIYAKEWVKWCKECAITQEVFESSEGFYVAGGYAKMTIDGKEWNLCIDDYEWPFLSAKAAPAPKPLLTLDFNYSLNQRFWNKKLEEEMLQKAQAAASSEVRRTLREWPWGKILAHELDLPNDKIHFFWKADTAQSRGLR
jgi:hypothetical protein